MGLTRAEKHNRNLEATFKFYNNHQKSIPGDHLLNRYLEIAEEKLNLNREHLIGLYKNLTVKEWEILLKLGWNK